MIDACIDITEGSVYVQKNFNETKEVGRAVAGVGNERGTDCRSAASKGALEKSAECLFWTEAVYQKTGNLLD